MSILCPRCKDIMERGKIIEFVISLGSIYAIVKCNKCNVYFDLWLDIDSGSCQELINQHERN